MTIRVFCTTDRCTQQAAQLCHAQQTIATLRGLCDAAQAERDALALQLAQAQRELAEAKACAEFYMDMFVEQAAHHA